VHEGGQGTLAVGDTTLVLEYDKPFPSSD